MNLSWTYLLKLGGVGIALLGVGMGVRGATCEAQVPPNLTQAAQGQALPAASLQVSIKAGRLTVIADNADIRAVLKAIFDQTERQFTVESGVNGTVTLRLIGQPLKTVLDALCDQTYILYKHDAATGIYRFGRNEEAVRQAIARIRVLDSLTQQRLQTLGIQLGNGMPNMGYIPLNSNTAGVRMGGGFGGGTGGGRGFDNRNYNNALPPGAGNSDLAKRLPNRPTGDAIKIQQGSDPKREGNELRENLNAPATANNGLYGLESNGVAYQQFANQNNFVSFNVPYGSPQPVVDLLFQLSQQANVPILIDPEVPKGQKFRIEGKMSSRPLSEALNLLAPYARLEWRLVGNTVLVTTAPDFQVFFGESGTARYSQRGAPLQQRAQKSPASEPNGPQGGSQDKTAPPPKEKDPGKGKGE